MSEKKIKVLQNLGRAARKRPANLKYSDIELNEMLKAIARGVLLRQIADIYGDEEGTIAQLTRRAAYRFYLDILREDELTVNE